MSHSFSKFIAYLTKPDHFGQLPAAVPYLAKLRASSICVYFSNNIKADRSPARAPARAPSPSPSPEPRAPSPSPKRLLFLVQILTSLDHFGQILTSLGTFRRKNSVFGRILTSLGHFGQIRTSLGASRRQNMLLTQILTSLGHFCEISLPHSAISAKSVLHSELSASKIAFDSNPYLTRH